MFGSEFYPTPQPVIAKMLAPYCAEYNGHKYYRFDQKTILEPSAGRGDIADVMSQKDEYRRMHKRIDCCEIDFDLAAVLQNKGHSIVANDFLSFRPAKLYDLIIMNPPFSNGHKHLLHAWDILSGGDIVCLLNEETVLNPNTKSRKMLADIIKQFGSVELLGSCFDEADRKTGVRVALVRLHKDFQDKYASMFEEADFDALKVDLGDLAGEVHLPATRDRLGTLVIQYNEALERMKQMMVSARELSTHIGAVRGHPISKSPNDRDYVLECLFPDAFVSGYNKFVDHFTMDAWTHVINQAGLDQLMTKRVRDSFWKQIQENNTLAFTVDNIHALANGLRDNIRTIMADASVEVFDLLTRYHECNRVYVEGWKTNDMYKVGKKFILPNVVEWFLDKFSIRYAYHGEGLRDIDRVMCNLEGRKIEDIVTIRQGLQAAFDSADWTAESEFFTMRYYKKGTVHFRFKDDSLRERFCIEVAKGKNWLPHDYTYKEHGPILELEEGRKAA